MSNALQGLTAAGLSADQIRQLAQYVALRGIDQMRKAGYTDNEIFSRTPDEVSGYGQPGAQVPARMAGGYGLLGPETTLAGITSTYNLGRGNLANSQQAENFTEADKMATDAANPANIVKILDMYARTGTRLPVDNAVLENIQPSMPTPGTNADNAYITNLLNGDAPSAGVKLPAAARGAHFIADEPTVGIGVLSGRPKFTLGEDGPEQVDAAPGGMQVTPLPGVSQTLRRGVQQKMVAAVTPGASMYAGRVGVATPVAASASGVPARTLGTTTPRTVPEPPVASTATAPAAAAGIGGSNAGVTRDGGPFGGFNIVDLTRILGNRHGGPFNGYDVTDMAKIAQAGASEQDMQRIFGGGGGGGGDGGDGGDVAGMAGGGYYGFDTPEEAQQFAQQTAGYSGAQRSALSGIAASARGPFDPSSGGITLYGQSYHANPGESQADFESRMQPVYNQEQTDKLRGQYGQYSGVRYTPGVGATDENGTALDKSPAFYNTPGGAAGVAAGNTAASTTPTGIGGGGASGAGQTPLAASERLLGAGLDSDTLIDPRFTAALKAGTTPGLEFMTQRAFDSLNPARQQALIGILQAAGYSKDEVMYALKLAQPAAGAA